MRKFLQRSVIGAASAGAIMATGLLAAPSASAVTNPCNFPYFCLYYNSNRGGAIANFYQADPSFGNNHFAGSGNGRGQIVKNNAASAQNTQTGLDAWVFYNSNYGGTHDTVTRGSWRNLSATYNENASFNWHS